MLDQMIRMRATDESTRDRIFLQFENIRETYEDFYRRSLQFANLFHHMKQDGPFHVGLLMENYPEFVYSLGGCAFAGSVLVGVNYALVGEELARSLNHMDSQLLLTEPKYIPAIQEVMKDLIKLKKNRILVTTCHAESVDLPPGFISLEEKLDEVREALGADFEKEPVADVSGDLPLMIVFTSGTTGAPKGIVNNHYKFIGAGSLFKERLNLGPDDVAFFNQPLFHSNSMFLGLMPAFMAGAGIAFRNRFSSGQWLKDVRRFGATSFSYVGKTMSYLLEVPPTPHDRDHKLRIALGNGAAGEVRRQFGERYGLEHIVELYSSTEAGVTVAREPGDPLDSVGVCPEKVQILNPEGKECPPAEFDADGRMINADEAIGEIVNTIGLGMFDSYYNNPEATDSKTRDGMYWSGDLGHIEIGEKDGEPTRFLYFDGRTDDWIRCNGENFPAEPIEKLVELYHPVSMAAVYGVPCHHGDDEVMCAVVKRADAEFDPAAFHKFLEDLRDMQDLWMPRYVRILQNPPLTETNKLIKKRLQKEQVNPSAISDPLYVRDTERGTYFPFTPEKYLALVEEFKVKGRERFLDL